MNIIHPVVKNDTTEISPFIKSSLLYNTLCSDTEIKLDMSSFQHYDKSILHRQPFKINNDDELTSVLHTIRYWMVNDVPIEIFEYIKRCDKNKQIIDLEKIKKEITELRLIDELIFFEDFIKNKIFIRCDMSKSIYSGYESTFIDMAAAFGYVNCLKYYIEHNNGTSDFDYTHSLRHAMANGRLNVLQYTTDVRKRAIEINTKMDKLMIGMTDDEQDQFIESDQYKCIIGDEYIDDFKIDEDMLVLASNFGNIECLNYGYNEYGCTDKKAEISDQIYNTSNIECLKFAHSIKKKFPEFTIEKMKNYNYVNGGKYNYDPLYGFSSKYKIFNLKLTLRQITNDYHDTLFNYKLPIDSYNRDCWSIRDSYKPIKFKNIYQFLELFMVRFSKNIECLRFAFDNGCQKNDMISLSAVFYDCLDVFYDCSKNDTSFSRTKFIIKNQCPIGLNCANMAACFGNLDMLKFLVKNGCSVDYTAETAKFYFDEYYTLSGSEINKYYQIIKYVFEKGSFTTQ